MKTRQLFKATAESYTLPGSELKPLKALLPPRGNFSLVTDKPYESNYATKEVFFIVQNYLTPRLVNPQPVEDRGLVFCSNHETAMARLAETGYRFERDFKDGKGIITKTS
jgi:hypothetical protein